MGEEESARHGEEEVVVLVVEGGENRYAAHGARRCKALEVLVQLSSSREAGRRRAERGQRNLKLLT